MLATEKLAVDGGPKSIAGPLPGWPQFNEETRRAVAEVKCSRRCERKGRVIMGKLAGLACGLMVFWGNWAGTAGEGLDFKKAALYPNGKVFPLVMYAVSTKDFAEVKAAGFNCVHIYWSSQTLDGAKTYLDKAKKHGLFVMQNMPSGNMGKSKEWWANWVKALSKYDNLAWWYPPEESAARKIRHICEAIRENDPKKRPSGTYIPWNSEKTIGSYQGVLDMLLKSSYPTYYKQPRVNIVSWMENIKNAGIRRNIAVAELFGGKKAPNAHRLRFDHYTALVMGSQGMCWYKWSGGGKKWPKLLQEAKRFAWEMSGQDNKTPLGAVLLSKEIKQTIQSKVVSGPPKSPRTFWYSARQGQDIQKSWPSILSLEKKHKGYGYLIVVNAAQVYPGKNEPEINEATVQAEFSNLPQGVKNVEVLFEKRNVPVKDGVFQDTFKELGVHIYRFKAPGKSRR